MNENNKCFQRKDCRICRSENLEKERNNAKAYARSRQNFRPFHNSNRSNELIGEMDDHPDTKLEIVARDLSQTLNQ